MTAELTTPADQSDAETIGEAATTPDGMSPAAYEPLSPLGFLDRARDSFADRTAVVDGDLSFTYTELYDRVARLGGAIARIADGRPVSVIAPNSHVLLEAHFGVPWARVPLVAINTRLSAFEVTNLVKHSESSVLIYDPSFAEIAAEVAKELPEVQLISADGQYEELLASAEPIPRPQVGELDVLSINYTSGTTGRPKGVMYHHRGAFLQAIAMMAHLGIGPDSGYLWTLPMFHCNGWTFPWAIVAAGGTQICLPKVDPALIWEHLRSGAVTHMCGAPTVMSMLAFAREAEPMALPVKLATGGAPPSPAILRDMDRLGFNVIHVYGLTEVYGPAVLCVWQSKWDDLPGDQRAKFKARQGVSNVVGTTARIVDLEGNDLPRDGESVGEILLRGNNVMLGYLRDPEATAQAFAGGWFHTGDLGVLHPDGYIELRDRSKDVIISGGENITSVEVEQVIADHPAVLEVAVVAMPHEKWGEVPAAFVTLKDGQDATESDIVDFVKSRLARYKAPGRVVFGHLPKTSTGKIQKFVLREEMWKGRERRIQ